MKDRIKQLRKELNYTQQQFGEKIGVKANTVGNYEIGLRLPSTAVIKAMCREFNVSEDWLRTGNGEMYRQTGEELAEIPQEKMGNRIRKVRKALGLNLEKFGERIGITASACSTIETEKNNPSNQTITSICREFNVREEWLRTGDGPMYDIPEYDAEVELDAIIKSICENSQIVPRVIIKLLCKTNPTFEFILRAYYNLPDKDQTDALRILGTVFGEPDK